MTEIEAYAAKWGRDPEKNFAVECYRRYGDARGLEPVVIHAGHASPTAGDTMAMQTWRLTLEEWRDAVNAAWRARRAT